MIRPKKIPEQRNQLIKSTETDLTLRKNKIVRVGWDKILNEIKQNINNQQEQLI